MKQIPQFLPLFLLAIFSSCAPLYVPTAHNTPMFSGKKEFQASASIVQGIDVQTAYSITNHIGVTVNYMYSKQNEKENGRTHQVGEIGLGYYTNIKENWCFEFFGGISLGRGSAYDSAYFLFSSNSTLLTDGKYTKFFLQPSVGMNKGSFVWNFSVKLCYVDFTSIHEVRGGDPAVSIETKPKSFFEPVINCQVPIWEQRIFGSFSAGLNLHMGEEPFYDYEPFMGSIGLVVKLKPDQKRSK